jgi:hypothetical protein
MVFAGFAVLWLSLNGSAGAASPAPADKSLLGFPTELKSVPADEAPPAEWTKPIPLSFSIDYTMVSDYMFRGINFSEYSRRGGAPGNEGREALNHQLSLGTELDLGQFGRVGGGAWFEWYADQNDPSSAFNAADDDKHLQETDYFVYYGYEIAPIGLDVEVGFTWYLFPRASAAASGPGTANGVADADTTQELYLNLGWDDSLLWRALGCDVAEPVLNPYLLIAWDLDLAAGASYYEFGLSHDFALSDLGCAGTPVLKDITVTPSWSMAWDHNWLDRYTLDTHADGTPGLGTGNEGRGAASNGSRLMNMTYGLVVSYDVKSALGLPDQYCGGLYVNGFLNFSHALADHFLDDNLWGGLSVGYEW